MEDNNHLQLIQKNNKDFNNNIHNTKKNKRFDVLFD